MKVVLNKCYGGFGLSKKAAEACIALGMTVGDDNESNFYCSKNYGYYAIEGYSRTFRSDPRVVQVVEQLKEEANGDFADLKVVDIPFDTTEGWTIEEYDGREWISEEHRTW
jgi:hypothetical protein